MVKIVTNYYGEERAGTFLIAKGFQREHFDLVKLIKKHEERFIKLENNKQIPNQLIMNKVSAKKAGRPIKEFMLNEAQTIFLGTLFRNISDIILDFKMNLAKEFINLKTQNSALKQHKQTEPYQITRNASKLIRRDATDKIQEFIDYAKFQGGTKNGCEMYYTNITKMLNGMLFIIEGKHKNLREVMSIPQLMTTFSAEQIIKKALTEGMKNKMFYKEIYSDVKNKVQQFADLHGQSEIITKQLL